jgi:hypothetical protein
MYVQFPSVGLFAFVVQNVKNCFPTNLQSVKYVTSLLPLLLLLLLLSITDGVSFSSSFRQTFSSSVERDVINTSKIDVEWYFQQLCRTIYNTTVLLIIVIEFTGEFDIGR